MDMNIEKFSTLLTTEEDESQLLKAVRQLTTLKNPEDVADATSIAAPMWWGGWA